LRDPERFGWSREGTTWPIRAKPEGTPEDEAMKLDLTPEALKEALGEAVSERAAVNAAS
jgi:hypothetical protein